MVGFEYAAPTKIVFGKGVETKVGVLIKEKGAQKVLLHYGGKSAKASGLLDRVAASLQASGIAYVELGGVRPNPYLSLVRQGIDLYRKEKADFILAVGGGSVIDSAKAIAYGVAYDGDVWDLFSGTGAAPKSCEPLGCVLTIAAAGSETSDSCVITNDDTTEKRAYGNDIGRPAFALMNPELTATLPAYQTSAGCADILMHTLERYFTDVRPTMSLTDGLAEALMLDVMKTSRILYQTPDDYDARANIMLAGALSHIGLTELGNGSGDWTCHQIGHELSAKYDLTHGASLTAVWGSWARYVCHEAPDRFARLAAALGLQRTTREEMALAGIEAVEAFFRDIHMPTSFPEAGIQPNEEDLRQIALGVTRNDSRKVGAVKKLDKQDIIEICNMAGSY